MKKRKVASVLLTIALTASMLAGCGAQTTQQTEAPQESLAIEQKPEEEEELTVQEGGTLTIALNANVKNLDPFLLDSHASNQILSQVGDTLIRLDENGRITPNLATDWEISEDRTEYTFTIRDDVYFAPGKYQDGRKMTTEDVAWCLNRSIDYFAGFLSMLEKAEAIDDTHVKCTLHAPNASFMEYLDQNFTVIVPKEEVEGWGDDFTTHVVGTGAFMLEEHKPDEQTILVPNPNYWGEKPHLDKIVFKVILDSNQAINALRTGEVDIALSVTGENVTIVSNDENLKLYRTMQPRVAIIGMNTHNEILSNPDVRKAIVMATDYDALVEGTYRYNEGVPAKICIPLSSWAYREEYEKYVPSYDPEAAKQLLAEAGYPDGFKITLNLVADDNRTRAVTIFQQMMKQNLNIDVEIVPVQSSAYMEMLTSGTVEMWASSQQYSLDPAGSIGFAYATEKLGSNFNAWGFSDPEVDKLIAEAASLDDEDARMALYDQIAEKTIPSNVGIWYANESYAWGVSNKVHNLQQDTSGIIKLADAMHNVWIEH